MHLSATVNFGHLDRTKRILVVQTDTYVTPKEKVDLDFETLKNSDSTAQINRRKRACNSVGSISRIL